MQYVHKASEGGCSPEDDPEGEDITWLGTLCASQHLWRTPIKGTPADTCTQFNRYSAATCKCQGQCTQWTLKQHDELILADIVPQQARNHQHVQADSMWVSSSAFTAQTRLRCASWCAKLVQGPHLPPWPCHRWLAAHCCSASSYMSIFNTARQLCACWYHIFTSKQHEIARQTQVRESHVQKATQSRLKTSSALPGSSNRAPYSEELTLMSKCITPPECKYLIPEAMSSEICLPLHDFI